MLARSTTLPPFPHAPPAARRDPKVSVVITNRDYAIYLPAAIDSALAQPDAEVEVIVVDDGSVDGSRAILDGYGDRIRVLLLDGRGQKAAFNAGFAAATGDVMIFLDSDDELRPGTAAAVARTFAAQPGTARVVFPLEVIDEHGRPTGALMPPAALPAGDVRAQVLAFPDDLAWPPTSGNAFAAWVLRRLLPFTVDDERTGADMWLHPLAPLFGPVVALDAIGGSYRLHGANAHGRARLDVERSRFILRHARVVHARLDELARELGLGGSRPQSVTIAVHRLLSLRLGGPGHPIPGDSRGRAVGAGLRAARARVDAGPVRRAAYALWFLVAATVPPGALRALADASLQSLRPRTLRRRLARR